MTSAPTILHGDCLQMMAQLADGSVDAVVTDPPYGLSFMGKRWDYDVPAVAVWAECLRVLKPGGHLLAFAGTRTQHRMAVRIEDAGFEIRDMIAWVYGSGFPKSLDVSKAIDKQRTEDLQPAACVAKWLCDRMTEKGVTRRDLCEHFNAENIAQQWTTHWTDGAVKPRVPKWGQWLALKALLQFGDEMDAEVWRLNGRKGQPGDVWHNAEVIGEHDGTTPGFGDHRFNVRDTKIRAASETALQWQGWGTALKPALEPITVARKPLAGTVAENVLAHGVGALNIDGCRVGDNAGWPYPNGRGGTAWHGRDSLANNLTEPMAATQGRWPANLIHDGSEEVVGLLPDTKSGSRKAGRHVVAGGANAYAGGWREGDMPEIVGDSGSAARFFYCAKASKADRDEGCEGLPLVTHQSGTGGAMPVDDDGSARDRFKAQSRNHHPTVKPTDLMRYLCRLVTPPGGTVLDPFTGSGSTGKAAILEGFRFIGIEREAEYVEIARARIASVDAAQGQLQMERRR